MKISKRMREQAALILLLAADAASVIRIGWDPDDTADMHAAEAIGAAAEALQLAKLAGSVVWHEAVGTGWLRPEYPHGSGRFTSALYIAHEAAARLREGWTP